MSLGRSHNHLFETDATAERLHGALMSLQAKFLVASPHLSDPNFNRTVVLIIKHDEEGAFGVILSRPLSTTVGHIMKLAGEEIDSNQPLYYGGPVQGPLVVVHSVAEQAEGEILPGVYFSAHKDQLRAIFEQSDKPYRVFSGYSGWGSGQLEHEMEVGGWLTADATAELVFLPSDDLWPRLTRDIGLDILGLPAKSKQAPIDPSLN